MWRGFANCSNPVWTSLKSNWTAILKGKRSLRLDCQRKHSHRITECKKQTGTTWSIEHWRLRAIVWSLIEPLYKLIDVRSGCCTQQVCLTHGLIYTVLHTRMRYIWQETLFFKGAEFCFVWGFYGPQTKFAKVMFSQVAVCPQGCVADTPQAPSLRYGQQAGGTHTTGMHSC